MSHPCETCIGVRIPGGCTDICRSSQEWKKHQPIEREVEIIGAVIEELRRAESKYDPMKTKAHGYGVIREEFSEFEHEVFAEKSEKLNDPMRRELVQIAAMCIRMIKDLVTMTT